VLCHCDCIFLTKILQIIYVNLTHEALGGMSGHSFHPGAASEYGLPAVAPTPFAQGPPSSVYVITESGPKSGTETAYIFWLIL
jgi:hypothetical protein